MPAELKKDMPIDEYHNQTDVISKSMLGDFADCPARFKYRYIDGGKKKESKSLRMGNAVHTLALEPELWKKGYHIMPDHYYNDKGEKLAWRQDLRIQAVQDQYELAGYIVEKDELGKVQVEPTPRSKIILAPSEYETVEKMANAIARNQQACSLLKSPGYAEASIFWEQEHTDETGETHVIKKRCRPDFMRNDSMLVDLKIARSTKPELFWQDAFKYHYHLSVAMSFEGYEALYETMPDNYVFVCVEEEEPNIVECFESLKPMPNDELTGLSYFEYGRMQLNKLMAAYVECKKHNRWPGYQQQIGSMAIPGWALNEFIRNGV